MNNMFEEVVVAQYEALFPYLPGKNFWKLQNVCHDGEEPTTVTHGKKERNSRLPDFLLPTCRNGFLIQTRITPCVGSHVHC